MSAEPIQRTVNAATAPRVQTTAPNSPFNWRPPGADLAEPEEPAMRETPGPAPAPTPAAAAAPASRNVQMRVLEAIGVGGKAVTRSEIAKALPDLNSTQLTNALFNASGTSRAQRNSNNGWTLTADGRAYLQRRDAGPAHTPPPRAANSQPKPQKARPVKTAKRAAPKPQRKPKRIPVADIVVSDKPKPAVPSMLRSFRCAVYSDGGFMLAKGDARIELDADEHAGMLRYLERMAEDQASA